MDDILKSLKAFLYERSASPLAGAYLVALFVINYRVLFILFSGDHYAANFFAIDTYWSSDFTSNEWINVIPGKIWRLLLLPASFVFLYLYVYLLIADPVYKHSLDRKANRLRIKYKADETLPLSPEKARELWKRMADLQALYDKETTAYAEQVAALSRSIDEREREISEFRVAAGDDRHGDEADIDEYDGHIQKAIAEMSEDQTFTVSELFIPDIWRQKSKSTQIGIRDRFEMKVQRGDFPEVAAMEETNDTGELVYRKIMNIETEEERDDSNLKAGQHHPGPELTEEQKEILIAVSGDKLENVYSADRISRQRISYALDALDAAGLITNGPAGWYALPKGHRWLDERGILK